MGRGTRVGATMGGLVVLLLVLGTAFGRDAAPATITAAATPPVFPVGVVTGSAHAQLAAAWDDSTATQSERAYCVVRAVGVTAVAVDGAGSKRLILRVEIDSIAESPATYADPKSIRYRCPEDAPTLHVHTPTSCEMAADGTTDPATCRIGGMYAWFCGFSLTDETTFLRRAAVFHVVQCDRHAFVFWWHPSMLRALQ